MTHYFNENEMCDLYNVCEKSSRQLTTMFVHKNIRFNDTEKTVSVFVFVFGKQKVQFPQLRH